MGDAHVPRLSREEAVMTLNSGDPPSFEETSPKTEFSELIRLGIAFAAFIRRVRPARHERAAPAAHEVAGVLPSAELPPVLKGGTIKPA
jgi:hypothetical protein